MSLHYQIYIKYGCPLFCGYIFALIKVFLILAIIMTLNKNNGGVAERLTRRISNLRIAGRVGSNPVRGKRLFP
jgi:hypothetical protein